MARKKKLTLEEFKSWLEGLEDGQPDGWSPDKDQWAKIRERIGNIKETVIKEVVEQPPVMPPMPPAMPAGYSYVQPPQQPPTGLPPAQPAVPPNIPLRTVDLPEPEMTEAARQLLKGGATPGVAATSKTPDLDTSDGQYESSFG